MPRAKRTTPGGYVYHVLNRGVGRMTLFNKPDDYQAFLKVLVETCDRWPSVELLAFCLMPNRAICHDILDFSARVLVTWGRVGPGRR